MYIVILAGGSGTRFWPVSRTSRPKQLISITDGPTMLQRTVERVLDLKPKRIMVVTNQLQKEETEHQLSRYRSVAPVDLIAEPVGRNTAPAVGLAAAIIVLHDPEGIMVVLPADHYIRNDEELRATLHKAIHSARNGWLMTLGIVPVSPETGYGYLEADMALRGTGPFPVRRFMEKPDRETALACLEAGNFFWNSGIFVWRADSILAEIEKYMPELALQLDSITLNNVWDLADFTGQITDIYARIASQSIDYGVMEKSDRVQMVPADIGWSDLGSWSALPDICDANEDGTVVAHCAAYISLDSSNCIVSGNGGVVATLGMHDTIVVSTGDAVLVCPRDRAQDVRKVVDRLQKMELSEYL